MTGCRSYERKNFAQPEGFSTRLRDRMNRQDVSCYSLSSRTGVNPESIRKYCTGEMNPNITVLSKLCMALHCSSDYLIFGREEVYG